MKITPTVVTKSALRLALIAAVSASIGLVNSQAPTTAKLAEPMAHSMMSGMENMKQMKPTGDVDKDFAMMMKAHHESALDMARIELATGKSAELSQPNLKRWPKASLPAKPKKSRNLTSGLKPTHNNVGRS